ncbi:hypothetical protein MTO96_034103 [Rhipicephalus appendiculatus]
MRAPRAARSSLSWIREVRIGSGNINLMRQTPITTRTDGYRDPGCRDARPYVDTADDSWRQQECRERGLRRDYEAYENRGYEPDTYARASDGEVRERDYYRDSGCEEWQSQRRHDRGGDCESHRNDGQRKTQDWHSNSYDDDFYGEQRKLTRSSSDNQRGSSSQRDVMRDENSDHEVDFYDCYGGARNVRRRNEGEDSFDRGYNAHGSQRPAMQGEDSCDRGYNAHRSQLPAFADSEAGYRKGYHHGQDYSRSSTPEGCGNDPGTSDDYRGKLNGKYRGEEEYVEHNSDHYGESDRHYTKVRRGAHRDTEVSYIEPSSYSHEDVRELSYDHYRREDDQHHVRSRKSGHEYDDRYDTHDTYHGHRRNQGESDTEEHSYCRTQRVDDEYLPQQSSPHMDRRQSPIGSFRVRGLRRTDALSVQRCVDDRYSTERESHVYRNSAYEGDDVCGSEDVFRAQALYQEERSRDDQSPYHKQMPSDDNLFDFRSERFVGKSYSGEDIVEGRQREWHSTEMESESPQLDQSSDRKRHEKELPKLALTPEPAAQQGAAIPRRTPLTPTTFSPNGDTKDGLLEIPRCAESERQQRGTLGRRAGSLVAGGSQRFATMKNARRIAEEMGMEEARADARAVEEQAEEFLEEFHGKIKRTSWAKRYAEMVLEVHTLGMANA